MFNLIKSFFFAPKWALAVFYAPCVLILFIALLVSEKFGFPISLLTKDPLSFTTLHPLTGAISNIGILLWAFSFAIGCFSFALLKALGSKREVIGFILYGVMISAIFMFDDLFMVHEWLVPKLFGLDEKVVMALYAFILCCYVAIYRKRILSHDITFLFVFFGGLGTSVLIDAVPDTYFSHHYILEDGAKFVGIVSWLAYQFTQCLFELRSAIHAKEDLLSNG